MDANFLPRSSADALETAQPVFQHDPRTERINRIRCDLVVDRDQSGSKLGLIDHNGFVSEHALAQHLGCSRLPTRDSLAGLVARRILSVVPGKGYEVALLRKEAIDQSKQVGYDPIEGLRSELSRTATAAFEGISAATNSAEERKAILGSARAQIECAAVKSKSNSVREQGEAVFLATETIGHIGTAAGLRWGGDNLRSGLDILEISTRWNRDQKGREVFEGPEVTQRVETCRKLLDVLTGDVVTTEAANGVFSGYLNARVNEVKGSIGEDSAAYSPRGSLSGWTNPIAQLRESWSHRRGRVE